MEQMWRMSEVLEQKECLQVQRKIFPRVQSLNLIKFRTLLLDLDLDRREERRVGDPIRGSNRAEQLVGVCHLAEGVVTHLTWTTADSWTRELATWTTI